MARIVKTPDNDKSAGKGGKKRPPKVSQEEDEDDGDIATPKRDRTGDDDQPL